MTKERIEDEACQLCPEELPDGLEMWIRNHVLANDSVLLYKRGNVRGTCFVCREKVHALPGQRFRQSETTTCPGCGHRVRCVLEGGCSFSADYVQNLAALQMGTDGKTLFIRQWHLLRDPTAQWEDIPAQLEEIGRYAIRGELVAKWLREGKENYYMNTYRYSLDHWDRVNGLQVYDGPYLFMPAFEAAQGTRLQYADLQGYLRNADHPNVIRYMIDFVRYPVYEFLWKAGYHGILQERIRGSEHSRAILWQRKTLRECFEFPLRLLKEMAPEDWTLRDVDRLKRLWKAFHETESEQTILRLLRSNFRVDTVLEFRAFMPIKEVIRYLAGGTSKAPSPTDAADRRDAGLYLDYLKECRTLGLDLSDRQVAFPADLIAAHARTSSQIEYQKNKAQYEQFEQQARKAERYAWQDGDLFIRPARTAEELRKEGAALHHCVGGYVGDMAKGRLCIYFVRRVSEPDKPFYTLDLRQKEIYQCRTKHNASYEKDQVVFDFVSRWLSQVVRKEKVRKTA